MEDERERGTKGPRTRTLTEGAREFDADRGREEAVAALLARVTGGVVDYVGGRVGQDGRVYAGGVEVVKWIFAGGI